MEARGRLMRLKMDIVKLARFHRRPSCQNKKQTPWPLVREGTIPTERPPFVSEI
jgi:hypothetical protein